MPVLAVVDADCYSATIQIIMCNVPARGLLCWRNGLNQCRAGAARRNGLPATTVSCDVLVTSLQLVMLGQTIFPADMVVAMMSSLRA